MPIENDVLTEKILGCAIEVHKNLGPGLLESVYEECLFFELLDKHLLAERQKILPIMYKGKKLQSDLKIDILVENLVILELKSVEKLLPIHEAQLITYLKLSGIRKGLLINFNVKYLDEGIKRRVL
ncbi:MAG: GxxExxY protein [Ignavibacteria bacterium]|nr:GxxExxY protein [Ignavibacteria bacterium]